jgi:uncharacterized cupredoxin-like copper-binding protein
MRRPTLLVIAGLIVLLVACSGGRDEPAASDEVRMVSARLSDEMAIEVSENDFTVGETVRFEVTNTGAIVHEFYLGTAEEQAHHADEMEQMGGMGHDEPNGVAVEPGATETLEYTFTDAGEILAGCHEPGHYDAGMVTSLTVNQ